LYDIVVSFAIDQSRCDPTVGIPQRTPLSDVIKNGLDDIVVIRRQELRMYTATSAILLGLVATHPPQGMLWEK
jgi:hypothetical protein